MNKVQTRPRNPLECPMSSELQKVETLDTLKEQIAARLGEIAEFIEAVRRMMV